MKEIDPFEIFARYKKYLKSSFKYVAHRFPDEVPNYSSYFLTRNYRNEIHFDFWNESLKDECLAHWKRRHIMYWLETTGVKDDKCCN